MKISITNKSTKEPLEYSLNYYSKVSDILDTDLKQSIQKSFEKYYLINDIDIIEDNLNFESYISDEEILIASDTEGNFIGFSLFQRIDLLKSMGLFLFLGEHTSPKVFKNLLKHFFLTFVYLKKDSSEYIYFDTKHLGVFKWIKEFVPTLKYLEIRKEYFVCYAKTDSKYINNIILNNYEFNNA